MSFMVVMSSGPMPSFHQRSPNACQTSIGVGSVANGDSSQTANPDTIHNPTSRNAVAGSMTRFGLIALRSRLAVTSAGCPEHDIDAPVLPVAVGRRVRRHRLRHAVREDLDAAFRKHGRRLLLEELLHCERAIFRELLV